MKIVHSTYTRIVFLCLALLFLSSFVASAQVCPQPAFPPSNVTYTNDRDQMVCQLGLVFPPAFAALTDCRNDPNHTTSRNARPSNAAAPCGNWTDDFGYTITSSGFGLWVQYDDYKGTFTAGTPTDTPYIFPYGPQAWRTGAQVYTPIDLLKMNNGAKITTVSQWWNQRRPEMASDLQNQLYGSLPAGPFPAITWSTGPITTGTDTDVPGYPWKQMTVTGTIDTSSYPAIRHAPVITGTVRVPANATGPVPLLITLSGSVATTQFCFTYGGIQYCFGSPGDWQYTAPAGYGIMSFNYAALQPDSGASLTDYIIGLMNHGNWRKPTDWGALRAWGWGVSRLIDYFEQDQDGWVDAKRIGLEGHSRWGKATLVAMAFEPRISLGYPSCGGSGGTKMNRRHWGENIENSAWDQEYHWFAGNFFNFMGPLTGGGPSGSASCCANTGTMLQPGNGGPGDDGSGPGNYLPRKIENMTVDAHSLFSMVAPNPVFTNAGTNDTWEDPWGQYQSTVQASPVYNFLGKTGVVVPDPKPVIDKAYLAGDIGFRYHNGPHTDTLDFPAFIQFAQKYWSNPNPPASYDITSSFAFFKSGYTPNVLQHTFTGTVQVINNTRLTINAPLYLVFQGLPAGVTLVNAAGTTSHGGYPYIGLPPGGLISGQTTTVTVKFSSPGMIAPTYTAGLWNGL